MAAPNVTRWSGSLLIFLFYLGEIIRLESRHLVPRFVVKHTACLPLEHTAPLLEEKRDAALQAIVSYLPHPIRLHGVGTGS